MQSFAPLDVLLVRHAEPVAVGTPEIHDDDRPLTDAGRTAADELAAELDGWEVTAIYSSPYERAVQTVTVLAERRGLAVQLIEDLRERRLSPDLHDGWQDTLARSWADLSGPGASEARESGSPAPGCPIYRPLSAAAWMPARSSNR